MKILCEKCEKIVNFYSLIPMRGVASKFPAVAHKLVDGNLEYDLCYLVAFVKCWLYSP